jgi:hypothetical protein
MKIPVIVKMVLDLHHFARVVDFPKVDLTLVLVKRGFGLQD